ncbi:conserved hypothetical protein [Vibrio phage 277E43-1]|nr:conserved hypothetical protein [Vibrio phage 277E43-1]
MIIWYELMKMFNLDEKPYLNLGVEWCKDDYQIMFVEYGVVSCETLGKRLGNVDGIVCMEIDVQQFLGWQPAVFSEHLEIAYDDFEEKYGDIM